MTSFVSPSQLHSRSASTGGQRPLPLPFGSTLGIPARPVRFLEADYSRITNPLASPTPLQLAGQRSAADGHDIRFTGADHTLGSRCSEQEDGNDSDLRARMAALGLNPRGQLYYVGDINRATFEQFPSPTDRAQLHAQAQAQAQLQRQQLQYQYLSQVQAGQQQEAHLQALATQQDSTESYMSLDQLRQRLALRELQQSQCPVPESQVHTDLIMRERAHLDLLASQTQRSEMPRKEPLLEHLWLLHGQQHQQYLRQQLRQQQQQQQAQQEQHHHEQQRYASAAEQRNALAVQVQHNFQARTNRAKTLSPDDPDLHHSRLDGVAGTLLADPYQTPSIVSKPAFDRSPLTPTVVESPRYASQSTAPPETPAPEATVKPAEGEGHFQRADQVNGTATSGSVSASLAAKEAAYAASRYEAPAGSLVETAQRRRTETTPALFPSRNQSSEKTTRTDPGEKASNLKGLGLGKPNSIPSSARSMTTPVASTVRANQIPRATSFAGQTPKGGVVRQPLGPPGGAKELAEKNFQSRIRQQARLKLGMLGRRIDSPAATPVLT